MEKWPRRVAGVEGWGGGAPRCLDHLEEGGWGRGGEPGREAPPPPERRRGRKEASESARTRFSPRSSLNVWTGGDSLGGRGSARVTAVSYFQVGRGRPL